ncbi:protein of unknown function [endosymbiont DhMRE of Dentiscutata heterogama]|nr:protein of unknown function [endosymbiont DhMRE of Dentiscutata heterogama]
MYRKDYFSPEQWTELERVLNQKQEITKNQSPLRLVLTILSSMVLIMALGLLICYLIKKKKKI